MGYAIICDRCKEIFNGADGEINQATIAGLWNEPMKKHLCDGCRMQLDTWLSGDDLKKKK